jgi:hypothetical protein
MTASEGIWSEDGRVCAGCEQQVVEQDRYADMAQKVFGGAVSSVVLGGASILCNPCLVISVISIGMGLGAVGTVAKSEKLRQALGDRLIAVLILAFTGIGLAIMSVGLDLLRTVARHH